MYTNKSNCSHLRADRTLAIAFLVGVSNHALNSRKDYLGVEYHGYSSVSDTCIQSAVHPIPTSV